MLNNVSQHKGTKSRGKTLFDHRSQPFDRDISLVRNPVEVAPSLAQPALAQLPDALAPGAVTRAAVL